MGGAQSRRKPGSGPGASVASVARMTFGANIPPPKSGYFILSLKEEKIKVPNLILSHQDATKMPPKSHRNRMNSEQLNYSFGIRQNQKFLNPYIITEDVNHQK